MIILINAVALAAAQPVAQMPAEPSAHDMQSDAPRGRQCCCCCCDEAGRNREDCAEHAQHRGHDGH